jgi:tRNA(Arg) A34 adenosine deaminase TadA
MKTEDIIKTLTRIAEDVAPVSNARIAAAVVYKGDIVSIGVNSYKSDPMQAKYSKNEHAIYLHAEIAALKKAKKLLTNEELRKSEVYVVRRKTTNGIFCDGLAKPCVGCQRALDIHGITKIHYTK